MITDSEKRWLRDRKLSPNPYCGWCMKYALCCSPLFTKCPTKNADLDDALEFEGRTAVKLAKVIANLVKENPFSAIEVQAITPDLILKWARLSVEKMDADSRRAE